MLISGIVLVTTLLLVITATMLSIYMWESQNFLDKCFLLVVCSHTTKRIRDTIYYVRVLVQELAWVYTVQGGGEFFLSALKVKLTF